RDTEGVDRGFVLALETRLQIGLGLSLGPRHARVDTLRLAVADRPDLAEGIPVGMKEPVRGLSTLEPRDEVETVLTDVHGLLTPRIRRNGSTCRRRIGRPIRCRR